MSGSTCGLGIIFEFCCVQQERLTGVLLNICNTFLSDYDAAADIYMYCNDWKLIKPVKE